MNMKLQLLTLACPALLLAACNTPQEQAREQAEKQVELAADQSARAAGNAVAALGMTERQLLDADLVSTDGTKLGGVEALIRGPSGAVEQLLIEVEDSNPDRFVHVPLDGLTPDQSSADRDIVTNLTRAQIAALPDAPLPSPAKQSTQN